MNKWFSNEGAYSENGNSSSTSKTNTKIGERTKIRKSLNWHDVRRYDSISTIRTHDNANSDKANSDKESESTVQKPYFHASQGTLISFESSV